MSGKRDFPLNYRILSSLNRYSLLGPIRLIRGYLIKPYLTYKDKRIRILQAEEIEKLGNFGEIQVGKSRLYLYRKNLHDYLMLKTIEKGDLYEVEVTTYIRENLMLGRTFVDLGANNGYYTIIGSELVGSSGKVLAIEPQPNAFERLEKNILSNGLENVLAFKLALSDFTGTADIYLNEDSEDGLASLINSYNKKVVSKVDVKRFDDLFKNENISLIKMDVEGSEILVIRGMSSYLETHPNVKIIMEWSPAYRTQEDFIYLNNIFNIYLLLFKSIKLSKIRICKYYELPIFCNVLLEKR